MRKVVFRLDILAQVLYHLTHRSVLAQIDRNRQKYMIRCLPKTESFFDTHADILINPVNCIGIVYKQSLSISREHSW